MTRGSFRELAGSMEKKERTRILLIMPRSFRPEYESITKELEINDDVFSTYLRPRSNLDEIKDAGFDSFDHSMHLIDIAMKDLGIWMKPLVSNHWNRSEIDISPTSNCDFSTVTWTCFKHPESSDSSTILLPFDPLDFEGKCFIHLSSKEEINEKLNSDKTIEKEIVHEEVEDNDFEGKCFTHLSSKEEINEKINSDKTIEKEIENEEVEDSDIEDDDEGVVDEIIEVVAEENTEPPLKVEVRQTIEMLKADGLDMTEIMEHPKFLDVSERASGAGIDVWTMVVGMFQ